jgi:hypothetical protein
MRLGVEDDLVEVQCIRRREEKVEVFERLREQETLHRVGFFLRDHTFQCGITVFGFAVLHENPSRAFRPSVDTRGLWCSGEDSKSIQRSQVADDMRAKQFPIFL